MPLLKNVSGMEQKVLSNLCRPPQLKILPFIPDTITVWNAPGGTQLRFNVETTFKRRYMSTGKVEV